MRKIIFKIALLLMFITSNIYAAQQTIPSEGYWDATLRPVIQANDDDLDTRVTANVSAITGKEPLKGADDNYVTDAEKIVIQNTSGTNAGDQVGDGTTITGAGTVADPFVSVAIGTGDVVGPGVAVDSNLAGFDTTSGKLIKDTLIAIADVFKLSGTQTVTGDKTFTGVIDTSGASSNTTGPLQFTSIATLPTAIDGKTFIYTGAPGFLGNSILSFYDGTTPVYGLGFETLPTTTGDYLSFNSVTGKWDISSSPTAGSFAFDTYPVYEDSAHNSGIAVNATTLAVYSASASKWLTVGLTDSLDPTPVTYDFILTVAGAGTVTIDSIPYTLTGSPHTITGLSGVTPITALYDGTDTLDWTGSATVTGTYPTYSTDIVADTDATATYSASSACLSGTYMASWNGLYPADTDKLCIDSGSSNVDGTQVGGTLTSGSFVVTDNDQYVSWPNTANNIFDEDEGTVWVEVLINPANTSNITFFEVSDGTASNISYVYYQNSDGRIVFYRAGGGVIDTVNSSASYTFATDTTVTIGLSWSVARSTADMAVTTNKGTNWVTDGVKGIATMATDPTTIMIGQVIASVDAGQGCTITKMAVQAGWETTCPW